MKRVTVLCFSLLVSAVALRASSAPQLFQKAKAQYAGGFFGDALSTLAELEKESQEPESERIRQQLRQALAFYRGACLAELGRSGEAQAEFATFLSELPAAVIDKSAYPKKTVAAFEAARKAVAKRPKSEAEFESIVAAYAAFKMPQSDSGSAGEAWANGPVKHLMTADERREWSRRETPLSRSEFMTEFWARRNPKPGSADNEFRREFEKRIAFADSRFGQDETPGSLTDRGMVFVLLGPPTYIGRKPISPGEDSADPSGLSRYNRHDVDSAVRGATTAGGAAVIVDHMTGPTNTITEPNASWREVWHYRKEVLPKDVPYQSVDFEFITKKGYGKSVLRRDDPAVLASLETGRKAPATR